MKKLFTLIALTSAIIPALHGMDTNLPVDVQKKYDHLTVLIQNADIDAFKSAFDALTLPAENIAALRQTIAETKTTITNELNAMGDKTKNWSKIVKGGLASIGGLWAGVSIPSILWFIYKSKKRFTYDPSIPVAIGSLPIIIPTGLIGLSIKEMFKITVSHAETLRSSILVPNMIACLYAAYKGLTYGKKTLKAGLNYKEYLQNMLTNLDVIDAHITQAKA